MPSTKALLMNMSSAAVSRPGGGPVDHGAVSRSQLEAAARSGDAAVKSWALQQRDPFALGVHDPVSGCSVGVVDRFAVSTLCWRSDGQRLHFAERADVVAAPGAQLDPQAVLDYLVFHCIPSPRTIFKGVHRVPPAHVVVQRDGHVTQAPYWVPQFIPPRERPAFEALKGEFRAALRAAVASGLDGGTPACFLSGGTDSSTVAGMIREATGQAAHSYSIGFDAAGYDEMAFARLAAKRFGCKHHEYYVTPDDLVRSIPAVAASLDQPFGNSSILPAYYCALQAKADGVTRLLAGDGGDELFGGNSRYAKQRIFGWYGRVPALLREAVLEPVFGLDAVARAPGLKKGSSYIEQARMPMPDRLQMYNLLLRLGVSQVLTPQFLSQVDQQAPLAHQRQVWAWADGASDLNRTLAYDWRYTLGESDLPKVRGATALAGVEVAYPMLDRVLLDLSLRLPESYKLQGLKLRWFFKEALRGFLPDEIINKPKQGFGLPFGPWLLSHAGLRRLAEESLDSLAVRGVVQPAFIRTLLRERVAEHPGYYGEMVWILMMLEQWLQAHAPAARFDAA